MRGPTLTHRGWFVGILAGGALLMGIQYGARGLNAIVAPAVVLLVAGFVSLMRVDHPEVTRRVPRSGFVGDTVRVELTVETARAVSAVVEDDIPTGLDADAVFRTSLDNGALPYTLYLRNRGVHSIGPARITVSDILDLWEQEFVCGETSRIMAYPRVRRLATDADLILDNVTVTEGRDQFDDVREYRRGDPLRDINWKASAKGRGELIVTEYSGGDPSDWTRLGVSVAGPGTDRAAEALVSLAAHLLRQGIAAGVITARADIDPGFGPNQLERILDVGARLSIGELEPEDRSRADILIVAPADGSPIRVEVDDRSYRFHDFLDSTTNSPRESDSRPADST